MFDLCLWLFYLKTLEVNFVDADGVSFPCLTSALVNSSQSPSECRTLQCWSFAVVYFGPATLDHFLLVGEVPSNHSPVPNQDQVYMKDSPLAAIKQASRLPLRFFIITRHRVASTSSTALAGYSTQTIIHTDMLQLPRFRRIIPSSYTYVPVQYTQLPQHPQSRMISTPT